MNSIKKNRIFDIGFSGIGLASTLFGLIILVIFIGDIIIDGAGRINWDFLTSLPSRKPEKAGIFTAMIGSIWVLVLTAAISFPIGVAAGIYLEKYANKSSGERSKEDPKDKRRIRPLSDMPHLASAPAHIRCITPALTDHLF